ncbi:MAG: hypothetical protein IJV06_10495 [Bacteroidaceae bacterium]|nr:hypothetical protein [Bacteroidaceae bacterium]
MKKKVVPSPEFIASFQELGAILVERGYFSSLNYAKSFTRELADYIKKNAASSPKHPAPPIFNRYGNQLQYFLYNRSAQTTWYIFLEETEDKFIIKHITNSQFSGQYFNQEN